MGRVGEGFPGAVAQLEEHLPCTQGVVGSNPISSTKLAGGFIKRQWDAPSRAFRRPRERIPVIRVGVISDTVL